MFPLDLPRKIGGPLAFAMLAIGLLTGCSETMPQDKPQAPDMSSLVASYDAPSLDLTQSNIAKLVAVQLTVATSIEKARQIFPTFDRALKDSEQASASSEDDKTQGDPLQKLSGGGFLRVTTICPGPAKTPSPNPAHGNVHLTVGFTDRGLDPVVWGGFSRCSMLVSDQPVWVDGSVDVHIGSNLWFAQLGKQPTTIRTALAVSSSETTLRLDVDFRLQPDGKVEYRLFDNGQFLIYWENGSSRGIRANNGTWTCDPSSKTCVCGNTTLSY